jgi:8-oxo-dGTP pyrophosphatase MutT (NUDIX family)
MRHTGARLKRQLTMPRSSSTPGAGLVLFNDEGRTLVLLKGNGKFDIPKGHCDSKDVNMFSTAQRECYEETQIFITLSDLLCQDQYHNSGLVIFCAKTQQDPVIEKNPETGELEHIDFYWMNPESAIKVLPDYLSDAVRWSLKYAT